VREFPRVRFELTAPPPSSFALLAICWHQHAPLTSARAAVPAATKRSTCPIFVGQKSIS